MCFGDEELMSVQYLGLALKGGGVGWVSFLLVSSNITSLSDHKEGQFSSLDWNSDANTPIDDS